MAPSFFETHCHLNHALFDADRAEVLARARAAGVSGFLIIGCDAESNRRAVSLSDPERGLYAAVGIHPHDAEAWSPEAESEIRRWVHAAGTVAIGEIGLDFYRDLSPRDRQYAALRAQLDLAAELDLPIVVHTRESVTPALDVIEPYARAGLQGVMHCWSGTVEEARRARSLGLLLGIGGVVTYKKPGALPEVLLESPLESLLLETDCPYLPPVPHRGQRNEPSYIPLIAERLAEIRGTRVREVADVTRTNAQRLFRLFEPRSGIPAQRDPR